jgi:flagellar biosynthesis/type III secretory pathway protein FliH
MNRHDRRLQEREDRRTNKEAERYAQMIIAREKAKHAAIYKIEKNGITLDDLDREYQKGYSNGFNAGAEPMYRTLMAALALALHEKHGFGAKRVKEMLRAVDEKVIFSLTSMELVQEVFDKLGLEIKFGDPFEQIGEK